MYKVLIVDDENLVIKSLVGGVDWEKLGFFVAATATNGIDALALIEEIKPNIVFTDIRMPGISGLELIKKAKEIDNSIQFIVISGYAEFAYVQKSLNYGVLGYCLKPFDDYEIDMLLKRASENLNVIKEKRYGELLLLLEESTSLNSQEEFEKILCGEGITDDEFYIVVSIGKEKINFNKDYNAIYINIGSSRNIYLIQAKEPDAFIEDITSTVYEKVLGVGVVKSSRIKSNVIKGIEDATIRAWDFFIGGEFGVFFNNNLTQNEKANQLVRQVEAAVAKKDPLNIGKILDEILTAENRNSLSIMHALKIYNTVYFHGLTDSKNVTSEDYIFSREQLYHLFHDLASMVSYLKVSLNQNENTDIIHTENETKNASLREIIKFVSENYGSDISIQSISKEFYLNPNYLSQLFKRELNLTFTEYLTRIRISNAKNLLNTSSLSIGEIAENIGYKDYFYFIRIFKKYANQTPGQYRNRERLGVGKPTQKYNLEA